MAFLQVAGDVADFAKAYQKTYGEAVTKLGQRQAAQKLVDAFVRAQPSQAKPSQTPAHTTPQPQPHQPEPHPAQTQPKPSPNPTQPEPSPKARTQPKPKPPPQVLAAPNPTEAECKLSLGVTIDVLNRP